MATIQLDGVYRDAPAAPDFLGALNAGWQEFVRLRRERQAMVAISRLGPRAIQDIGPDPERVREVAGGGWDDLDPLRLLMPGSRRER